MRRSLLGLLALAALGTAPAAGQTPAPNALTAEERADGFRLLFDGTTGAGWRGYRKDALPAGWQVVDGGLTRVAEGGDIVTDGEYGDFELRLQWNVAPGGNSGIMFRVSEDEDAPYESGPEMQVLDDARHADGRSRLTAAGSAFGLYPAPAGVVRPAGTWNDVRLVVRGSHVEHWLNGTKVVEYELWSDEWKARVAASKFHQWPAYGMHRRGHIALQDHGDRVAYRAIRLRELP